MSSAKNKRTARYKNWAREVEKWEQRPIQLVFNKSGKGEMFRKPKPKPTICHICYYRKCRCGRI